MKNEKVIKIIRVAKKYYEQHIDQKDIAAQEGISVSTVSRMLQKAQDMGYVKIHVEYPVLSNEELSASLQTAYGLKKVFIVPKLSDNPESVLSDVCKAAAGDLPGYVKEGAIIGTAWGRTMKCLSGYISDLGIHNVKAVQMIGKVSSTSIPVGADDLLAAISKGGDGEAYVIPAPVAADAKESAEILRQETNIARALELGRECDVALLGIGGMSRDTILYRSGCLTEQEMNALEAQGAVGDMCAIFFDTNGKLIPSTFDARRISISPEELKAIPYKIVVVSGMEKKEALHGALMGGFVDILYADEELGQEMMNAILPGELR